VGPQVNRTARCPQASPTEPPSICKRCMSKWGEDGRWVGDTYETCGDCGSESANMTSGALLRCERACGRRRHGQAMVRLTQRATEPHGGELLDAIEHRFPRTHDGEPMLLKTHAPHNPLVGGRFLSGFLTLRVSEAWRFGEGTAESLAPRSSKTSTATARVRDRRGTRIRRSAASCCVTSSSRRSEPTSQRRRISPEAGSSGTSATTSPSRPTTTSPRLSGSSRPLLAQTSRGPTTCSWTSQSPSSVLLG
jgi:hypothetical protein